jgi:membrane protein DedA with SNARE-associated domain
VVGGLTWGTGFTLLGFLAGAGYEIALRWAHRASLAMLIIALFSFLVFALLRWLRRRKNMPDLFESEEEPHVPARSRRKVSK